MIAVTVERPPADRQGPDISDALITTAQVAAERGRNEIDHNCSHRTLVSLSGPYRRWVQPGALVEYRGRRETYRGMVKRFALTITRNGQDFTADMAMELERLR